MRRIILILSLLFCSQLITASNLLIEAESFDQKGGWVVDQQFMDLMGSPYLMAHGMGVPVEDASTTISFPESGTYYVYVRTYNWTSPWHDGKGPGKFTLKIGNKKLPIVLGDEGNQWMWQPAGKISVKAGNSNLTLKDLTGFNGRCDAIYFTTEKEQLPPNETVQLTDFRKKMLDIPAEPEQYSYDVIVTGGGIAGMCAAATASRLGCKVALINDRPVLGGNNSSEVRVHLGGNIGVSPNSGLGRMIREFGHSKEGNAKPAANYEDEKKELFIANEKNITLYANYRAISVKTDGNRIESVIIKHIENGKEVELKAPLFSDCTGDGTIGYLAGADYNMGRESRAEYGEELAPIQPDKMTMGSSVQWYSADKGKPTRFPIFSYGLQFNEKNCEKVTMGEWKWETGMNFNQIDDFERIRDYGLMVIYSNWSFLKNELKDNKKYKNRALDWVAYIAGKRESRRLLGDYILKQDDIDKNVYHEDASFVTTWSIDLHFPDSLNASHAEYGEELAPIQPDKMTMGSSVQWYSADKGKPTRFPIFSYGLQFNEKNCEKVTMGEWKWETGMNFNQIDDFERIRDYGLMVIYSNWSFLKNELKDNKKYKNRALDWVAYIAGKRESRRLLGDYILKQDDIDKNVYHEDASFVTTWSIDLHFPDSLNASHFPDAPFKAATKHIHIYPYAVPYRCLYSRNIENLFMAGRNISVTHVALGTVRVMRTTGMMGEVVGMAASLCKKYNTTPRGVYQKHLPELKALMKEGVGKKEGIPDNQKFNEQKLLKKPRIFAIEKNKK